MRGAEASRREQAGHSFVELMLILVLFVMVVFGAVSLIGQTTEGGLDEARQAIECAAEGGSECTEGRQVEDTGGSDDTSAAPNLDSAERAEPSPPEVASGDDGGVVITLGPDGPVFSNGFDPSQMPEAPVRVIDLPEPEDAFYDDDGRRLVVRPDARSPIELPARPPDPNGVELDEAVRYLLTGLPVDLVRAVRDDPAGFVADALDGAVRGDMIPTEEQNLASVVGQIGAGLGWAVCDHTGICYVAGFAADSRDVAGMARKYEAGEVGPIAYGITYLGYLPSLFQAGKAILRGGPDLVNAGIRARRMLDVGALSIAHGDDVAEGLGEGIRAASRPLRELEVARLARQTDRVRELQRSGAFADSAFHGTSSRALEGIRDSDGRLLSRRALAENGIVAKTGEGSAFGGRDLTPTVSVGLGEPGLGTAAAYAEMSRQSGWYNPSNYPLEQLEDDVARLRIMAAREGGEGGMFWSPQKARELLNRLEPELELRQSLPAGSPRRLGGAGAADDYPIVFEFDAGGLNPSRRAGLVDDKLAGEASVAGQIDLGSRARRVYVPHDEIARARRELYDAFGHSDFEVLSLEALEAGLGPAAPGTGAAAREATMRHLADLEEAHRMLLQYTIDLSAVGGPGVMAPARSSGSAAVSEATERMTRIGLQGYARYRRARKLEREGREERARIQPATEPTLIFLDGVGSGGP